MYLCEAGNGFNLSFLFPNQILIFFLFPNQILIFLYTEAAPALKKWGGQEKFFSTPPIFYESHAHLVKEEPLYCFYKKFTNIT